MKGRVRTQWYADNAQSSAKYSVWSYTYSSAILEYNKHSLCVNFYIRRVAVPGQVPHIKLWDRA